MPEVELPGPDPAYALEVQKPQKILAGSIVDPFRQLLGLEGYAQIKLLDSSASGVHQPLGRLGSAADVSRTDSISAGDLIADFAIQSMSIAAVLASRRIIVVVIIIQLALMLIYELLHPAVRRLT